MGRKIVFTGGGSAGHVTPNIALMRKLREDGWTIEYIGSEEGIERAMIEELGDIPYHPIATGKLRRYFDINNFKDPLRVVKGISQSYSLLKRIRPDIVFSKGGFVSVPVIIGSRLNGIPAIIHESDMTPGLANKISIPLATKVCCTFRETLRYLPKGKAVHTGTPIREELLAGDSRRGMKLLGFHSQKPVVTVMGGSLGAQAINRAVRESLPELLKRFQLIHICGKDNVDRSLEGTAGYRQFEFVGETLPDLLAATDLAVSRAGANAIFEFLALRIPMLLIPLSRQASRGDQLLNAESFRQAGYCRVLYEEDLSAASLIEQLTRLQEEAEPIAARMRQASDSAGSEAILQLIRSVSSGA